MNQILKHYLVTKNFKLLGSSKYKNKITLISLILTKINYNEPSLTLFYFIKIMF